jgi:hypothetical protein|tara:strand:- start:155 stop:592 length:438 start_codon:yes stop_codon:yes gene_type:complete
MTKRFLMIFVMLFWCNSSYAKFDIKQMYKDCKVVIHISAGGDRAKLSNEERLGDLICLTYFRAMHDTVTHQNIFADWIYKTNPKNFLLSCPPLNNGNIFNTDILIKIFTRYVEDNPKVVEELIKNQSWPMQHIVNKALMEKFPCK